MGSTAIATRQHVARPLLIVAMGLCDSKLCREEFCMCDKCAALTRRKLETRLAHVSQLNNLVSAPSKASSTTDHTVGLRVFLEFSLPQMQTQELLTWRATSSQFTNLVNECARSISIGHCSGDTQPGSSMLNGWPQLRSISLRDSPSVTDQWLTQCLRGRPTLWKLDLTHCGQIRHVQIQCEGLTSLKLTGTMVTDSTLLSILSGCPKLVHIDLTLCNGLTEQAMIGLAAHRTLQSIGLASCGQLDSTALAHMGTHLTSLRSINLAGCHANDTLLLNILQNNPQLSAMNLTRCNEPSDEFLAELSQRGAEPANCALTSLNLSDCAQFSDAAIRVLADSRPQLGLLGIRARRIKTSTFSISREHRSQSAGEVPTAISAAQCTLFGRPRKTIY